MSRRKAPKLSGLVHREQFGADLRTETRIADRQKTPREAIGTGAGDIIRMY